jgi:hypothetical protein
MMGSFTILCLHNASLLKDAFQLLPPEREEQDVGVAFDFVVVIVQGNDIPAAERQEGFQQIPVFGPESHALTVAHFLAVAKVVFADFVGREPFPSEGEQ